MNPKVAIKRVCFLMLLVMWSTGTALAQTTVFTYQGQLKQNGAPANGTYTMQFNLFDTPTVGTGVQIGATFSPPPVQVTNGAFSVPLDFGVGAFTGAARYLEIIVNGTALNPRQQITSTPYAIRSLASTSADTATNSTQLGGVAANRYVQSDAAGNVSVGGNLTLGGTLSTDIINVQTQYNLGGQRILGSSNGNVLSVGRFAGQDNTTGSLNSFFGDQSGVKNTSGVANSYFGSLSGYSNTTGSFNSFFGRDAGANNVANRNSFFGDLAGGNNTTGFDNAFFGAGAGNANQTGAENSFFGKSAGLSNTTGGQNSFFGINAGINNTTGNFNTFIGSAAGTANQTGINNTFVGQFAGLKNTVSANSFFGAYSGQENTTGSNNSFFGSSAGQNNTTGTGNAFFGLSAGFGNTTGNENSYLGQSAGLSNTTGAGNTFVGSSAGFFNQTGGFNTFVGRFAGLNNIASFNAFFGAGAGEANTSGTSNTFVGTSSGAANVTGGGNSFFGRDAGRNNNSSNNSFFGNGSGKNNSTGAFNSFFGGGAGFLNTQGSENSYFGLEAGYSNQTGNGNAFFGRRAGFANTASDNSFFGNFAGQQNTTGTYNTFVGRSSGAANVTGNFNAFFGSISGVNSTGNDNSFFGTGTGTANTTGSANSFFGDIAGISNSTGSNNTIIGARADVSASNLTNASAIGADAVVSQSNSLVLGNNANVGIGTSTPNSKLTVVGLIETTTGGVKFPDGTTQTTAATPVNAILNQTTQQAGANFNISGSGTIGTNLSVGGTLSGNGSGLTNLNAGNITSGTLNNARLGLIPTANIADLAVTASKIASGQVVKNLNGLTENVMLAAGANVTITPSGNTLTIASAGGGASLTVKEEDGNPSVTSVSELRVSNGTLTDNGAGSVSITTSGTGGSSILNQTTQQTSANFNIDGTGKANVFDAATQYNLGGPRVLGNPGQNNLFAGIGAGAVTPVLGDNNLENTFFGTSAGQNNIDCCNAFFGNYSGQSNTTGGGNTFLGYNVGKANTQGSNNTFVGSNAGPSHNIGNGNTFVGTGTGAYDTGGLNNTFIGEGAGAAFGANNLFFATAIGAAASVDASNTVVIGKAAIGSYPADTVRIPGNLVVNGTFTNPSDLRLKTGVANLRYGLSEVMRLRPVTWEWKNDALNSTRLGLIAQEVQPVLPELIVQGTDKDRLLSMNYLGLLPVVIKAIQEQEATIKTLKNKIVDLQKQKTGGAADASACMGTAAPKAKFDVTGGNILVGSPGQGIILKSPDGATCKLLSIDNTGAVVLLATACP
ncbi:MAG: tail fiber domain-containing protein [Pyrinomonadaceae bacterium]